MVSVFVYDFHNMYRLCERLKLAGIDHEQDILSYKVSVEHKHLNEVEVVLKQPVRISYNITV